MLKVIHVECCKEARYAECRYAECCGALLVSHFVDVNTDLESNNIEHMSVVLKNVA